VNIKTAIFWVVMACSLEAIHSISEISAVSLFHLEDGDNIVLQNRITSKMTTVLK
jgi:hypothetical protein